jgi:hypothetical protein
VSARPLSGETEARFRTHAARGRRERVEALSLFSNGARRLVGDSFILFSGIVLLSLAEN